VRAHFTSRSTTAPGDRLRPSCAWLALATTPLLAFACFDESATLGAECSSDDGCGEGQRCVDGVCQSGSGGTGTLTDAQTGTGTQTGPPAEGCHAADLLFVVDNSRSMSDEQVALNESFEGFVTAIRTIQEDPDFHFMAVSCGAINPSISGNAPDPGQDDPDPCAEVWGAGRTHSHDGTSCKLADNDRYMRHDQTNLYSTFYCVADVGTRAGGREKPMFAMLEAVSEANVSPEGCNAGFLRDDAVLGVVFITDEDDDEPVMFGSPGNPDDWAAELIEAKHGNADAIAVLGLIGDGDLQNGLCPEDSSPSTGGLGAEPAPRLREFAQSFEHGITGSICAPDHDLVFLDFAVELERACEQFVPPR
jgi:hypothetical protein